MAYVQRRNVIAAVSFLAAVVVGAGVWAAAIWMLML